ncbi:GcrA family cell cycle regulator [Bradyrhizobium sp. Tv2a-2]|uniref:GcrA family cell cycle regulator n=1 Tax=Bradyrhizobium sp. Tv2a-2 TaxID=113395 RepID=UPI0003FE28C9|nr:GcrA family cell cycle regulator [Bradyrhizobium sp. Tv2a-2]
MRITWTDEIIEELKHLFIERRFSKGAVARFFSEKLGIEVTRNAIVGKLNRLGIKREGVTQFCAERKPRLFQPKPSRQPFVPQVVVTEPRMVPFAELGDGECQYECTNADGVGDWLFCGNPCKSGSAFCRKHHGVVWVRARKARVGEAA